jgi:hypothetical protein
MEKTKWKINHVFSFFIFPFCFPVVFPIVFPAYVSPLCFPVVLPRYITVVFTARLLDPEGLSTPPDPEGRVWVRWERFEWIQYYIAAY